MSMVSRRGFLKSSAVLAATVSLTGTDGVAPKAAMGAGKEFLQTRCGAEDLAKKKVLIAYAGMHGSTGEVADVIGIRCLQSTSTEESTRSKSTRRLPCSGT